MASYSMKVTLRYAQARRIECEHCNRPYTFVDGGTRSGSESDSGMFHDENELRRAAFRAAANSLEATASREQVGRGRCPHCHRLQDWMRLTAGVAIIGFVVLSLVVAGLAGFAATYFVDGTVAWGSAAGLALLGVVLSLVFGKRAADSEGPEHIVDHLVKTDEQLFEWIQESIGRGQDPFLRWWKAAEKPYISGHEKNTMEFPMGLWDLTKQPLDIPEALTTAARSAALIRLDA